MTFCHLETLTASTVVKYWATWCQARPAEVACVRCVKVLIVRATQQVITMSRTLSSKSASLFALLLCFLFVCHITLLLTIAWYGEGPLLSICIFGATLLISFCDCYTKAIRAVTHWTLDFNRSFSRNKCLLLPWSNQNLSWRTDFFFSLTGFIFFCI